MSRAGFDGNEFYYEDHKQRTTFFSLDELKDIMGDLSVYGILSSGEKAGEHFLKHILSRLKLLGDNNVALGRSLFLLFWIQKCLRDRKPSNVLLIGGKSSQTLSHLFADIIPWFSLKHKIFFFSNQAPDTSAEYSSCLLNMMQSFQEKVRIPPYSFDFIMLDETEEDFSEELLQAGICALHSGGRICYLTHRRRLPNFFFSLLPNPGIYYIDNSTVFLCNDVKREIVEKNQESFFPGFPLGQMIFNDQSEGKRILFLPLTLKTWKEKMESIYQKSLHDNLFSNSFIMPIPYCVETPSVKQDGEWRYEGGLISREYSILNYEWTTLSQLKPNVIVMEWPYNESDGVTPMTVDSRFSSDRLYEIADTLLCLSDRDNPDDSLYKDEKILGLPCYRKYILYGGSCWHAEKFWYLFEKRGRIAIFANDIGGETFHGKSVVAFKDIPNPQKYMILVATMWGKYLQIKKNFENGGVLQEFKNFYYAEAYIKKIAIIHSNCYGTVYSEFLNKSQRFTETYFIYPTPYFHEANNKKSDALLKACDLFIYQDVRSGNRFGEEISEEYVLPRLKKVCKKLLVPNLVTFGSIYYPTFLTTSVPAVNFAERSGEGIFEGEKILDDGFSAGKKLEEIRQDFLNRNIITDEEKEEIRNFCRRKLKELLQREEHWDVKISDFILKKYKIQKLFTDSFHPSRMLIHELCRRIAKALDLDDTENIELERDFELAERFVMPCVKDALGLTFSETYIRTHCKIFWYRDNWTKLGDGKMDVKEYIREYIYWKFGRFLD